MPPNDYICDVLLARTPVLKGNSLYLFYDPRRSMPQSKFKENARTITIQGLTLSTTVKWEIFVSSNFRGISRLYGNREN